ncbi:MAG: Diguanylate cyclase/phosphodiesterase [Megasphaera sp.]|jgi:diguanylate cyclase (GGDEF)-like protein
MDVASIQAELHRYYDKLIAGVCLIGMDESEPILFVNRGLLNMYHCGDEGEFYRLTGKVRKGMIEAADYRPLDKADDAGRPKFITFRFRTADGSYHWTVFLVLLLRVDNRQDLLLCCREDVWETARDRKSLLPILATSFGIHELEPARQPYFRLLRELCQSMIHYSGIKFFWKDRARRFAGVSQSFLDYYGRKDEKALIGKTDEDLGWIVNDCVYREAEMAVLEKGQVTRDVLGQCLVQGRLRQIASTKFPIYRGKRIIGLLGYFEDVDESSRHQAQLHTVSLIDAETGLLNFRGLLLVGEDYMEAYRRYGTDYVCVVLEVPEYEQVFRDYGDEVAGKLLQAITDQLLTLHSLKGSLAHLSGCRFFYITHQSLDRDFRNTLLGLTNAIHSLTDIGGYSCTLYLQYAIVQGSEGRDFDEIMQLLRERLKDAEEQRYGQAVYIGDRLVFDKEKFDKLDEEVSIIDPDTYELVYVNDYMQRAYGLSDSSSWVGEKCYKILADRETPCDNCLNDRLRRDCFYTATRRNRKTGQYLFMRTTLIPWQGKNYRFSMAFDLSRYIFRDREEIDVVFREVMANDVIAIGMREADPHTGLQKMLEKIGHSLQAERVLIFEEQPDQTVSATYEWYQEDLQPMAPTVQHIPMDSLRPLYAAFDAKQMAIIEDAQAFVRAHPGFTPHLSGVRRLVSGHLTQSGKSLGFTEVVNPSALAFKSASLLLSTLTLFLASMLRNRDTFRSLERLSTTDQLTGAGNRRGFTEYIRAVPDGIFLAFIFGDLNGLKRINDTQGHEAGDHLLQQAVRHMKALSGDNAVFRMGGDEFMVIARNASEQQAQQLVRELLARYRSSGISMALGVVVCQTPIANIDEVLSQADREMYTDKERIYTSWRHS